MRRFLLAKLARTVPDSAPSGNGVRAESFSPGVFFPFFRRALPRVNPPGETKKGKINMKRQHLIHILMGIACIGLLAKVEAVVPAPDGNYPGGNTAEGQKTLFSFPTATFKQPVGYVSPP